MARFALSTLLIALLAVNLSSGFIFGGDVLVLTKENIGEALVENENLLVMFYSPRCGYSRMLLPNFESAAAMLVEQHIPVKLGKVDCVENVALRKMYHIRKYPTLRLFRNGGPLQYTGSIHTYDLKAKDIVEWVKENIPIHTPATPEEEL
ncbi:protein disulfide-isomerase [Elysia marginata]|uniref:Protein disulfide-isomerase n=1 Tax=Elysia marginata TaxID=1093978 RepID=A0AAV4IU33_9GAST|nr:protein disulfide-isomerase [Elysia marginata]